jgi:hypothetical protein
MRAERFAVSVLMELAPVEGQRWVSERWTAVGVVAGESVAGVGEPRLVHTDGAVERYLYPGLQLELHRDDAPSYYANLMATNPSVFVVCREDEHEGGDGGRDRGAGGRPCPFHVTVSYGEATAFMETDEMVFAVPMPPELHAWVERYVLEHYVPEPMRKRKRADWKKETPR